MAEPNANLLRSAISFFTPPSQKAPTANPDHPNFFSIISATANLVKDNLFKDDKEGFKFKTPEDFQVEALKNWDTGSIDKNNPQNKDNYLTAIKKIMDNNGEFIKKCSESGVSKERIDKIKIYKKSEYIRLETNIINQPLKFVSHKIKLTRKPENFYTEGDVASQAYRELQNAQSRESKPITSLQKVKSRVNGAGKNALGAAREAASGTFAAVRRGAKFVGDEILGGGIVYPHRVKNDPDNYHLKDTLGITLGRRAASASRPYTQKDARNAYLNPSGLGYRHSSIYVNEQNQRAAKDLSTLQQLYGERNGRAMFKAEVQVPGASGRGGSGRGGGR